MSSGKVHIVLGVTQNYLWKLGLYKCLENKPGYEVAAEFSHGEQIIQYCLNCPPRLLVLDHELYDMSTYDLQRRLVQENIDIPILLVGQSHAPCDLDIAEYFAAGIIKGYILTACTEEQLIDAITHVSKNKIWCSPTCSASLFADQISNQMKKQTAKKIKNITSREQEVLNLMFKGLNNSEISDQLCLSINTVQNHICNIYSKLGVRERLKALNLARNLGLIDSQTSIT